MKSAFTLIELMVVIVIIGILAAVSIPKLSGMTAKAKAAEAPEVLAGYERLSRVYIHEVGTLGNSVSILYTKPTSKFFNYNEIQAGSFVGSALNTFGNCNGNTAVWGTKITAEGVVTHSLPSNAQCAAYTPNW